MPKRESDTEFEQHMEAALRTVIDPEIGINIVDLGLVYGVDRVSDDEVLVTMTMTTPACPMSAQIRRSVQEAVVAMVPGIERVDVNLVWQPPWGPQMMSDDARRSLGWLA